MTFDQAIAWILPVEGGYSNSANDPGGETKYGISKRSYPNVDIKNLNISQASEIYLTDFWHKLNCGALPNGLDLAVFDCGVNQGFPTAAMLLQKMVNVAVDLQIGPKTIAAIKNYNPILNPLINYLTVRMRRYTIAPNFSIEQDGWTRRLFNLQSYIDTGVVPKCYVSVS